MGQTPERSRYADRTTATTYDDSGTDPTAEGEIRYNAGDFKAKDASGVFNMRSGTGLTAEEHKTLRQLIHLADGGGPWEGFTSGAYRETTGTVFPTAVVWWESSSKLKKIASLDVTWSGATPTQEDWKAYDTDGSTVVAHLRDAISYSGVFETNRTRTVIV